MSHVVPLNSLAEELSDRSFAYLLTVADDGRPHAVAVVPQLDGTDLHIDGTGRRTRANVTERPAVSLVWPPSDATGHSLIVDGAAVVDGERVIVLPDHAVLHRPATGRCDAG